MVSLFELGLHEAAQADRSGDATRAVDLLRSMLDSGISSDQRYRVLATLSTQYVRQGRHRLAEDAIAQARCNAAEHRSSGTCDITRLDVAETRLAVNVADLATVRRLAERYCNDPPRESGCDAESIAEILCDLAAFEMSRSAIGQAKALLVRLDAVLASCDREPLPPELQARVLTTRAQFDISRPAGIAAARSQAQAALDLALRYGLVRETWYALHLLVDHHLGALSLPSVLSYGNYLLRVAHRMREPQPLLLASLLVAATEAQLGRLKAAWTRLERCDARAPGIVVAERDLLTAYVLQRMGRYDEALDRVQSARDDASRAGHRNSVGVSWMYEGRIHAAMGHRRKAMHAAYSAATLLEVACSPVHLAGAYRDLHALTGDTSFLHRERDVTSCFPAYQGQLEQLFAGTGEEPLDVRPFDGALTARQTEIAYLIREGHTNRQIARRLRISESTAAHHVGAILHRLGLRARWQLIEVADALPIDVAGV